MIHHLLKMLRNKCLAQNKNINKKLQIFKRFNYKIVRLEDCLMI